MSTPFTKHPLAIAWDAWIASDEGRRCADGYASGIYLNNRLNRAFMAGANTPVSDIGELAALQTESARLRTERDKLRIFAQNILDSEAIDDTDIVQGLALQAGLIEVYDATEPCGDLCPCAEVGLPRQCYRATELLTGEPRALAGKK